MAERPVAEQSEVFPVRHTGLFRCCIRTGKSTNPSETDGLIRCPSCHTKMKWQDGAWEWATLTIPQRKEIWLD